MGLFPLHFFLHLNHVDAILLELRIPKVMVLLSLSSWEF